MTDSIEMILAERQRTHGDFCVHALITQRLKAVMRDFDTNALTHSQREALDMIAHKIGRILAGNPNFKDHWLDLSGYAQLIVKEIDVITP